jgi:hypothetical protein
MTRGIAYLPFMGAGPAIGTFFMFYTPLKHTLGDGPTGVTAASVICAVPSTLVRIPADIVQKRLVLGIESSPRKVLRTVLNEHGWRGLFLGWRINMVKDIPFAASECPLCRAPFWLRCFCLPIPRVSIDSQLRLDTQALTL